MDRTPVKKNTRSQASGSQKVSQIASTQQQSVSASNATIVSNVQIVPETTSSFTAKTTTAGVAEASIIDLPPLNTHDAQQIPPPLMPGPNVGFQSSLNPAPINASANVELLQRQIETLQAQLLNAQSALNINVEQNVATPASTTPVISGYNFNNENLVERRSSNATPSSQSQQNFPMAQPINIQPGMASMPTYRKIYDLPEFHCAPEEWPMFLSALEHSTSAYGYNNFENCLRLQKALKGEARECVKSLLIHPNNVPTAVEQLKLQYGRPEILIRCQLQHIREVQPIGENAIEKLLPYSIKVRNLAAFLEAANGQQHLCNPTLMEELVQKLPMSKRLDWAQFASQSNQCPSVLTFSSWLQQVANLVRSVQSSNTAIGRRPNNDSKGKVLLHAVKSQCKQQCLMCRADHKLFECKRFIALSVQNRWAEVKKLRLCFTCLSAGHSSRTCRSRKTCLVNGCQRKHNKLLHDVVTNSAENNVVSSDSESPSGSINVSESVLSCVSKTVKKGTMLFRVVPIVLYGPSNKIETYALLDEGSSVTMVDSSLVKQLGLQGQKSYLNLNWYAGKASQEAATLVNMHVSRVGSQRKYALQNVYGVANLKLPTQSFKMDLSAHPGLPIKLYDDVCPRVLIGLDHCHLGLPDEIVPLEENGPYAANTPLGWIVFGQMKGESVNSHLCLLSVRPEKIMHDLMESYFETENFGVKVLPIIESEDDMRARQIMENTTVKVEGRFQTRLLWCKEDVVLPESYSMALNRLVGIERKMNKNPEFGSAYKRIIKDYLTKGYARKLSPVEAADLCPRTWYLPHFGVVNPNKPGKIRLVFDAAAQVEGVSLNTNLLKGPQHLKPLPSVLFNFRIGAVAVCGDIKEMFHQIVVAAEDRCSQRFLWRENENGPPDVYEMRVMTFGAACSPCIADYVKKKNALEFEDRFPRAVKSIVDRHYVDDFVDSFESASKAILIAEQVRNIHAVGGFEMRNFTSNSSEVVVALKGKSNQPVSFSNWLNESKTSDEKVLGMFLDPIDDAFKFILKFHRVSNDVINGMKCPTKREFLCVLMSIFDPNGFLCHFLITAKLIMREVWRHGILWDEKLSGSLEEMWNNWRQELKNVAELKIPRHYFKEGFPANLELHIFVDASEDAFGAVAYWRYFSAEGNIGVSFISAKTKYAPLKTMTIPRLELQAAVLGTRLLCTVLKEHEINVSRRICWSDSTTVVKWIGSESRRYKPFVAHRITEILEATNPYDWRWLPTDLNVADDATRSKRGIKFSAETRWFQGPKFLYLSEDNWPKNCSTDIVSHCEEELRPKYTLLAQWLGF